MSTPNRWLSSMYQFSVAGAEEWEVLIDFQHRQILSISCRGWFFGYWVVDEEPLQVHVRLENRSEDEMVCGRSDGSGAVI